MRCFGYTAENAVGEFSGSILETELTKHGWTDVKSYRPTSGKSFTAYYRNTCVIWDAVLQKE